MYECQQSVNRKWFLFINTFFSSIWNGFILGVKKNDFIVLLKWNWLIKKVSVKKCAKSEWNMKEAKFQLESNTNCRKCKQVRFGNWSVFFHNPPCRTSTAVEMVSHSIYTNQFKVLFSNIKCQQNVSLNAKVFSFFYGLRTAFNFLILSFFSAWTDDSFHSFIRPKKPYTHQQMRMNVSVCICMYGMILTMVQMKTV